MACFEPTIDYVVTKIPRFAFEKFPEADPTLTTQMKSVGETMAIGRTFKESFQKALRGLEVGSFGFGCDGKDLLGHARAAPLEEIRAKLATPERAARLVPPLRDQVRHDDRGNLRADRHRPLVPGQPREIVELEDELRAPRHVEAPCDDAMLRRAKQYGFSDRQLATIWDADGDGRPPRSQSAAASWRRSSRSTRAPPSSRPTRPTTIRPTRTRTKRRPRKPGQRRIMILGGGPNRIGQGIEFDYCCCHAGFALRELGIETIMVNSNPETVSTDYDTSRSAVLRAADDRGRAEYLRPRQPDGVIVQFGGQTPLNLARALEQRRRADHRHQRRHDRGRRGPREVSATAAPAGLKQPANGIARNDGAGPRRGGQIGFPVLVRPSYVLGGRAMEICYDASPVRALRGEPPSSSPGPAGADRPIPGRRHRGGRRRHCRRPAGDRGRHHGAHRGGGRPLGRFGLRHSAVQPAGGRGGRDPRGDARALARRLQVKGLMNIQFAVKREDGQPNVYVLEVNPRASRTVPFVSKATGMPLAKVAAKVMAGVSLAEQGYYEEPMPQHVLGQGEPSSRSSSSRASTSSWGRRCVRPAK